MRGTNVGLLIGLTAGNMAYIGALPGIYPFRKKDEESRGVELKTKVGISLGQENALELHVAQLLELYQKIGIAMGQGNEMELHTP